jgi:hypothetical protein
MTMVSSNDAGRDQEWARERRALQAAVLVSGVIPIGAGLAGVLVGSGLIDVTSLDRASTDSHFRYLSGLLLGVGLVAWSQVPSIERAGTALQILATLVVIGGLARLASLAAAGMPSWFMMAGLAMELIVTPALALWQRRIERRRPTLTSVTDAPCSAPRSQKSPADRDR